MRTNSRFHIAVSVFLPLLFLGGSVAAQLRYDTILEENFKPRQPVHRFLMPSTVVRYFAFGFENMLADYYWVSAVQDMAKWDRRDAYYPEYFRIISTLDPKFAYPYIFAALTVPTKNIPESLVWLTELSDRGIAAIPTSWEIPFYTGLDFHAIGKSYERAAHYLGIAVKIESSPVAARTAYGLFLLHSSTDYERSRALFQAMYETTEYEETKRVAKERIELLDYIEAIDRASVAYKTRNHEFPETLENLVDRGYIQVPPEIVKRYPIEIDKETGKASLR